MTEGWDQRDPESVDAAILALHLTEGERQMLAIWSRNESQKEEDFRYQLPDLEKRAYWLRRWREIADALHPDPWGRRASVALQKKGQ